MRFKSGRNKYKMSNNILYFQNTILNEKVKDKLKELLPEKKQQILFISTLYDIAVNEYVKTGDIQKLLKENEGKINFTVFKTLDDLSKN